MHNLFLFLLLLAVVVLAYVCIWILIGFFGYMLKWHNYGPEAWLGLPFKFFKK